MNLTQLYKMGLAVLFGFTLTLSGVGCNGGGTEPAGDGGEEAAAPADGGEEMPEEEAPADAPTDGSVAP